MTRKLLLPLFLLLSTGAGAGAGYLLRPLPQSAELDAQATHTEEAATLSEFVKLPNQFVVPVVEKERIVALVILSLSIEVAAGGSEVILKNEPKLRDSLLQSLFDHANIGGFRGNFTNADLLLQLRNQLLLVTQATVGEIARNVLITEIVRQDS